MFRSITLLAFGLFSGLAFTQTECHPDFTVEMIHTNLGNGDFLFVATANMDTDGLIWYFGDGTMGYGPFADHHYDETGEYQVCVAAWYWNEQTQDSCWTEACEWINVGSGGGCDQLEACFEWETNGNTVNFVNCSTNEPGVIHFWEFGDGTFSDGQGPAHVYEPGTYTVCLYTAWETCVDEVCHTFTIGGGAGCDPDFAVEMTHSNLGNGNFLFEATANMDTDGLIWYFGDGTMGYGHIEDHHYDEPGEYQVCVSAWYWNEQTQDSCWTEACQWINVGGGGCDWLDACFEWSVDGIAVNFLNCTPNETGINYHWDFGDGMTSTETAPTHLFEAGTHTVCLLATWEDCVDEVCHTFTIGGGAGCDPDFSVEMTHSNLGNGNFLFEATANMDTDGLIWYFGDGAMGYGHIEDHHYDEPGEYQVCVAAWYWNEQMQDSCWTEACQWINVGGGGCDWLDACFEWEIGDVHVAFINCTTNETGINYHWDFGDGTTSIDTSPIHFFEAGTHTVCLVATWENCIDEVCHTFTISGGAECHPDFAVAMTHSNLGNGNFLFEATANMDTDGMIWYFGDGTMGYGHIEDHHYDETGEYQVCVAAWYWNEQMQDSCWTEACEWINVVVGINEQSLWNGTVIHPNPANDNVIISSSYTGPVHYQLFTADGRIARTGVLSAERSLNVTELVPGIYVLKLEAGGSSLRKKLILE